ncbi:pre-mRNA branch site protein [Monoraphidium neglectum]|uniref:Pre-mRNA branch site protein n=1 Tax=Monoraphidium neglectum TaxID=145388 RepID=A0A0D2JP58_9CHLO|nr:pre-mRNA branch site protein [Monoraphidium neglectum]KIZ00928.1 pre-mRNA branch site protein [Monoraphidium neglectum]|eukprot:XP_013899947.1 pre-mRNA branch site protein [Monoraphidium neglectum]
MAAAAARKQARLPPEVNRILYVRNLPFNISSEEIGTNKETRGTAYVVFEDIHDAKQACDHLSGFNHNRKLSLKEEEEQVKNMQARYGVDGEQHARSGGSRDGSGGGGGAR